MLFFPPMIESNPVKKKEEKKEQGHLETPALWPEISLLAERCHSEPTLVRESLFNLYC